MSCFLHSHFVTCLFVIVVVVAVVAVLLLKLCQAHVGFDITFK